MIDHCSAAESLEASEQCLGLAWKVHFYLSGKLYPWENDNGG